MLPTKESLKLTDYPINLIVEATTSCNFSCIFCPYRMMKRQKGKEMSFDMHFDIIEEIATYSPKNTTLWYAFMGEPTLKHRIQDVINLAKTCGIKNVYLNTNGSSSLRDVIEAGVDKVFIGIDALTPGAHGKIRVGGNFESVVRHAREAIAICNSEQEVVVQFIETEENKNELEPFKEFWLKRGATVKIRKKLCWGGTVESKDLTIPQEQRNIPCPWLMRQMVILNDGTVAQCDADFEGKYSAGNIKNSSIQSIWKGELLKRRERHISGDFNFEPCKSCNDWQVGISETIKP